ncbi:unnamed protein product [Brachionus calyciflorus]|uniref:EF-hand domain-containing protein n=1 Tax=Brachionus calyciflorus TaxID=104777 RepID=A0A813Y5W3_9BILA|nr:unnamed protein product [Brachionus calyciflorus]
MGINRSKNIIQITKDDVVTLSQKANLTEEEILDMHENFLKNFPRGTIDKKQFLDYFSGQRPDRNADVFCTQLFNAFDMDKNGYVDFHEFLLTITLTSNKDAKQKLRVAFRMYDVDNDGKLSHKEIEKLLVGIQNFYGTKLNKEEPSELATDLLKTYDKDNNSFITEEEFVDGLGSLTVRAIEMFSVLRTGSI